MASGRSNKIIGQAGEFAVCAELGKRDLIATPFAGNVPEFDLLATNAELKTVPIQVKTTLDKDSWPCDGKPWLDISYDEKQGVQCINGLAEINNPDLIMVYVWLTRKQNSHDRFFILRKADVQKVIRTRYSVVLDKHGGKRPKRSDSYMTAIHLSDLTPFEGNWKLIEDSL